MRRVIATTGTPLLQSRQFWLSQFDRRMLATTRKPRKAAIVAPEPVKVTTKKTIPAVSSASEVEQVEEELEDLEDSGAVEARISPLHSTLPRNEASGNLSKK